MGEDSGWCGLSWRDIKMLLIGWVLNGLSLGVIVRGFSSMVSHVGYGWTVLLDAILAITILAGGISIIVLSRRLRQALLSHREQGVEKPKEESILLSEEVQPPSTALFTVAKVYPLDTATTKKDYPDKVRIVLKNTSQSTLHIQSAGFDERMIPIKKPRPLVFQHELYPGSANSDRWKEPPSNDIFVEANETFSTWVGVLTYFDNSKIQSLHEVRGIGVLLPTVDGHHEDIQVPV